MSVKLKELRESSIFNGYSKDYRHKTSRKRCMAMSTACIIVCNTVTGTGNVTMNVRNGKMCKKAETNMVEITAVNGTFLTIPGTLSA
ncbi:hypothetical protein KIN20_022439 [Parelaphostrongylus tenuis]|uniref:Uncharacterized protein n=1 Tax=Parelaphostrongylus tenuis TaxID=148309 RepID=A0AAD5N5L3_PARTN|nr:hypothetical protein KIN20_022439 [Parelaphostrongylus tenuis]